MKNGGGEYGEGVNIVKIANPLFYRDPQTGANTQARVPGISIQDPKTLHTSWNKVNDSAYRSEGRIGYSVKFVSLDSLRNPASSDANGATSHKNVDFEDETAKQELTNIKH